MPEETVKLEDWGIEIIRVSNGYMLHFPHPNTGETWATEVIEHDDDDELKSAEELLWRIAEFFDLLGSKHDKERLRVIREK